MLSLKGEKRCGESAAGFWAMQVINTANLPLFESVGGCDMCLIWSPANFAGRPRSARGLIQRDFPRVLKRQQAPSFGRGTPKKTGLF